MNTWQVQEAKARFSELLDKAENEGPQVITRYGHKSVAVLDYEQYQSLVTSNPSLIDYLLSGPKFEDFDFERVDDYGREIDLGD